MKKNIRGSVSDIAFLTMLGSLGLLLLVGVCWFCGVVKDHNAEVNSTYWNTHKLDSLGSISVVAIYNSKIVFIGNCNNGNLSLVEDNLSVTEIEYVYNKKNISGIYIAMKKGCDTP